MKRYFQVFFVLMKHSNRPCIICCLFIGNFFFFKIQYKDTDKLDISLLRQRIAYAPYSPGTFDYYLLGLEKLVQYFVTS